MDIRSIEPPPDLEEGALSSVTLAEACADSPLAVELHVMPNVSVTEAVAMAKGSGTVWLPLVALAPAPIVT